MVKKSITSKYHHRLYNSLNVALNEKEDVAGVRMSHDMSLRVNGCSTVLLNPREESNKRIK